MTLFEWLRRLLPDRCQMPYCNRNGIRGNEKIIDSLRMCNECASKHTERELERMTADFDRRLSLVDASRGKYGFFFDEIMKHDDLRMRSRLACLDALEAQCKSTETNTVAVLAAIHAERESVAAARRSMLRVRIDPTSRS
jgi:hypothetical protein